MDWRDSLLKEFKDNFNKRMWDIVRVVNPVAYIEAESYGLFDNGGPQIYGEMVQFLSQALTFAYERGRRDERKNSKTHNWTFMADHYYCNDCGEYSKYLNNGICQSTKEKV